MQQSERQVPLSIVWGGAVPTEICDDEKIPKTARARTSTQMKLILSAELKIPLPQPGCGLWDRGVDVGKGGGGLASKAARID